MSRPNDTGDASDAADVAARSSAVGAGEAERGRVGPSRRRVFVCICLGAAASGPPAQGRGNWVRMLHRVVAFAALENPMPLPANDLSDVIRCRISSGRQSRTSFFVAPLLTFMRAIRARGGA